MTIEAGYRVDDFEVAEKQPLRAGFGRGLVAAGRRRPEVVALCADLTDSTMMRAFADEFPERFIEVGVAEQNLVTVASGLARAGRIPFATSYAAFNPGRNWEQIRTTAALNGMPVKVVGSHAGVNVGFDGATHQMLEDIALMRVIPGMVVIAPGDAIEAEKATIALAEDPRPAYLRLARDATPMFTTADSPFAIGSGYRVRSGSDALLIGTGTMTYELLIAAEILSQRKGIEADVLHMPTVKPLDEALILERARRVDQVFTAEEAQVAGGLGGAVAELLSARLPRRLRRFGMLDRFGESGPARDLLSHFGLTGASLADEIEAALRG